MKRLATILSLWLLAGAVFAQSAIPADGRAITPQLANEVAQIIRGQYGVPPNLDETVLDLQNTNYFSLENVVSGDANTDFGQSQRLMVKSLFAFGASLENASFSTTMSMFSSALPLKDQAINDTSNGSPKVGLFAGYILVPTLVKVFVSMDIYLNNFFSGTIYFALLLFLVVMMGSAMVRQMHEGRLDLVSWIGKATFAILCMFKANQLCNYVLAAMIGLAAGINSSVISGVTSQYGIDQWYLKVYGPQLTRNCYSLVTGTQKPALAKAFSEGRDMYNIPRYVLYENGSETATTLSKYLGGAEGYNMANGANAQVNGVSLKELSSVYCLMAVYNVGLNNLQAHEAMGYADVQTDLDNFKLAIAQIYHNNDGLTIGDTSAIEDACSALTIPGAPSSWEYLANNSTDPQATELNGIYRQPPVLNLSTVTGVVRSRTPLGLGGTLWSYITSAVNYLVDQGQKIIGMVSWIPASIVTLITQGALQQILLGGLLVWILLSMALCKLGVILVTLTSPFIMLPNTSKIFWGAVKTMVYPSLYPAMLIVIIQLTSALASWIGTIAAQTGGLGLILTSLPLLFGLVSVIALPKLVKVMLSGGNVLMAQFDVARRVAMLAAVAATGGVALAGLGGAAAAGGAAAKGAGAAGSAAGGASKVGAAAGAPPVGASGGVDAPSAPIGRALAGGIKSVGKALGITDGKSAVKATLSSAIAGAPGLAWHAVRSNRRRQNET
ncbi:MAG: hypothetical protein IH623_10020 [Verrucomicrobia bacterium]|nr:hypothetical protein [Verrucomicrobiota bacterium]